MPPPRSDRPLLVALLLGSSLLAAPRTAPAGPATAPAGPATATAGPATAAAAGAAGSASPRASHGRRPAGAHGTAPFTPSAEARDARLERYRKWVRDWRARRDIHRKARLKRVRYRLQRVLRGAPITAEIRAELEDHARRLARLNRIKEVAIGREDIHAIGKVEPLLREENARHDRWMSRQQVRDPDAPPTTAGGAPAPTPTTAPPSSAGAGGDRAQ